MSKICLEAVKRHLMDIDNHHKVFQEYFVPSKQKGIRPAPLFTQSMSRK